MLSVVGKVSIVFSHESLFVNFTNVVFNAYIDFFVAASSFNSAKLIYFLTTLCRRAH